jgi:aspartate-semialdehyde dehydrogenase
VSHLPKKIPVAVLGATGTVGQRFIALLAGHPWFEVVAVAASERSAGKLYGEAARWVQSTPLPPAVAAMEVRLSTPAALPGCPLVFCALDAAAAGPAERAFADAGSLVVTNARSHRMEPDVPLVVPEVNGDHLQLVDRQRAAGCPGGIATNPNCSTIGMVLALKPLVDAFGVETVQVVTMQAVSGAGLPGVASLDIVDNLLPLIQGEEEKMQSESLKILGRLTPDGIEPAALTVGAQCNRVPVIDGHTLCLSVRLGKRAAAEEIREAFEGFSAEPQRLALPSAPQRPVRYLERPDGPQPRLHRDLDGGMAAVVGRLRECPVLDWKFVALSHNTLRGAAGGSVLLAEQLVARGQLPGWERPA